MISSTTLFNNKTAAIIRDANGTDIAVRMQAIDAFSDAEFSTEDLPFLHQAYLQQYPADNRDYETFNEKIERKIRVIADSTTIVFVDSNYNTVSDTLKMGLLICWLTKKAKRQSLY